jgi:hypothetical protein
MNSKPENTSAREFNNQKELQQTAALHEIHRQLMRIAIIILVSFLNYTISLGQSVLSKTEIIIIGTIHTGNKHFNHKTLYEILKRLNPDIILKEHSEKYKRVFGLRTATLV